MELEVEWKYNSNNHESKRLASQLMDHVVTAICIEKFALNAFAVEEFKWFNE